MGAYYESISNLDKALVYFEKALGIRQHLSPEDPLGISISHYNLGIVFLKKGEYQKALDHFHKSVTIKTQILGENHPGGGQFLTI